jgi:hypothetical protein
MPAEHVALGYCPGVSRGFVSVLCACANLGFPFHQQYSDSNPRDVSQMAAEHVTLWYCPRVSWGFGSGLCACGNLGFPFHQQYSDSNPRGADEGEP